MGGTLDYIRCDNSRVPDPSAAAVGCEVIMNKIALLRELLTSPDTLVMPDAYDPLSTGSSKV